MALPRSLCLIVAVAMLGLRPSAGIRTGSPEPGSWWGTQQARNIRDQARRSVVGADFPSAERLYQRAYELALASHDEISAIKMLTSIAGARFGQFHYRAAFETYLEARRRAVAARDLLDQGAIDLNLSSLYLQVWDFDAALGAAERSRAATRSLVNPYFEAPLLLQLARLHEILTDGDAERYYLEGIEAARRQGDIALEAKGWNYLGAGRLAAGDLRSAERALLESFRLESLFNRAELPFSWALIGALKLAQHDLAAAALFTDRAIAAANVVDATFPRYLLMHQRGEIHLARGQKDAALGDFAAAVELATRWRLEVPPSLSALTASNIELEKRIFDSFIEAAAARAVERHDRRMLERSLAAVALNRSASLRQTVALTGNWRTRLDPQYWEIQARLRAETARLLRAGLARSSESDQLNLELSEMEGDAKLRNFRNQGEKIRGQISLIDFQNGLSKSEVVLVLHLGRPASYEWAVTRERAIVLRLAGADVIRPEIERFRREVRAQNTRGAGFEASGAELYRRLFGRLPAGMAAKPRWLLSVDDKLFDLPFAALVIESRGNRKYLVEEHSLEVIPGALPVSGERGKPESNGWFLGVGDPIYNLADARLRPAPFGGFLAQAQTGEDALNRLVGSGAEIESSARSWNGPNVLLRGRDALRSRFLEFATRGPAIVHLATHVLIPLAGQGESLIAFSIGSGGRPEFLTVSDVSSMQVPGAVVVMSGCDTASGDVRAGAGLLGLTRAWQSAGASAVVSTAWPVADSGGAIFSSFYRHLRELPAAEALRLSQIEMLDSGSWRAAPFYWAAYQVSGGAR